MSATESVANSNNNNFDLSVYAGVTFGGDELADVEYQNASSQSIKAGGLINLGAGTHYTFNNLWSLQTNVGYHFDSDNADNADISFSRWAIDVVPYYQLNDAFKVGIGITYHLNAEFEFDIDHAISTTTTFDSSAGLLLSLGYQFENQPSWVELRAVSISYNIDSINIGRVLSSNVNTSMTASELPSIDGNHIGLTYHYVF